MLSFSLTLPATRAAVLYFHPAVVAFVRPVVAAVLAAALLIIMGKRPPARRYWKSFALVVLGVVIGVPLTFAWGMHNLPAAHGAITLALLPLATALVATLRAGEHASKRFWAASCIGSSVVLAFAFLQGAGMLRTGDIVLLLSVIASGVGYAEGARLTRAMPGWEVMSWALVMGAPFLIVPAVLAISAYGLRAPASAWYGFAYVCIGQPVAGHVRLVQGLGRGRHRPHRTATVVAALLQEMWIQIRTGIE